MSQAPLSKIARALQHDDPAIRARGINALVRSPEATPDNIMETLGELADSDPSPDVRTLSKRRLHQYRQQSSFPPAAAPAPADSGAYRFSFIQDPATIEGIAIAPNTFVMSLKSIPYLFGKTDKPPVKTAWKEFLSMFFAMLGGLILLGFFGGEAKAVYDYKQLPLAGKVLDVRIDPQVAMIAVNYEYLAPTGGYQQATHMNPDATLLITLHPGDEVKVVSENNAYTMIPPKRLSILMTGGLVTGIISTVGALVSLLATAGRMEKYKMLAKKGKVLDGYISSATITLERPSGRGIFMFFWRLLIGKQNVLRVQYQFKSPETGKLIDGQDKDVRPDLKGKQPPGMGSPVKVLYATDKNHMVL